MSGDAWANLALRQLSSDPYTNPKSQHRTELEPDTLAFGSTIVSAFQVGRFFNGGASNIGFATSNNGGRSWVSGFLPGTTGDATPANPKYERASDPSVAFDAKDNVWLISYLLIPPTPLNGSPAFVDLFVSRSTDGGLSWGQPVVVNASGQFNDKNWTVCDDSASSPFYGNCYTEFDNNTLGDLVLMSTSSDGGQTWGSALTTANKLHGIGGQPLVQPSGKVIVPINGFSAVNFFIDAFTSDNGGASWGPAIRIAPVKFRHPAGNIRASIPLPTAEIDASGRVYVVWSDCRFEDHCSASDMVMSTSSDGLVWSRVKRIPADPLGRGVDHFIPGLAVDRSSSDATARLVLTFYDYPNANCTTATCQLDVGFVTSADGGDSWSTNTQIAGPMALRWLPSTTQGFMVGDYISTSFSGGPAYPAIAVAHAPTGGVFDEATYTVGGGLTVAGSRGAASDQSDLTTQDQETTSTMTSQ
jgi:hypothetical protein